MFCDAPSHPDLHVTFNTDPMGKITSEVFAILLSSERVGTGHATTKIKILSAIYEIALSPQLTAKVFNILL